MVDPLSYFSFQPVLHFGVAKVVVCAFLSVGIFSPSLAISVIFYHT